MLIDGRRIDGAIFDIDGTLLDSLPVYCSAFNEAIARYELSSVPTDFLLTCLKRGENLLEIFRKIFPGNSDDLFVQRFKKDVLDIFLRVEATEVKPFPGVHELLRNLKARGIRIGVATGRTTPAENEWKRFRRYGLDGEIDTIVTSRSVLRRKPAPDVLIECARQLDIMAENCLAVGDTEVDIAAARSAGAVPIAISSHEEDYDGLKKENPAYVFRNIVELDLFLRNL